MRKPEQEVWVWHSLLVAGIEGKRNVEESVRKAYDFSS